MPKTAPAPAQPQPQPQPQTHCGIVAVLGEPNAGKSTLVNALVGTKVSIVSPKVQTTRFRVRGIVIAGTTQIILTDTPGIFKAKRRLDRAMVAAAWEGAEDSELSLLLVDAKKGFTDLTLNIIKGLTTKKTKAILALNKIDLLPKPALLALVDKANSFGIFSDIFMISAKDGTCLEDLKSFLASKMPVSPWLFPDDEPSDMPFRQLAAEITREKIFFALREELPYAITVETADCTEGEDGSFTLRQVIFVERVSQRKIILGKGGAQIKAIGTAARKELEYIMGVKINLFLEVKVAEKWGDDPRRYQNLGLDFNV